MLRQAGKQYEVIQPRGPNGDFTTITLHFAQQSIRQSQQSRTGGFQSRWAIPADVCYRLPISPGSDAHLQSSTLATCNPFNALPPRSNDTQKVIDTHCTFVLF